MAAAQSCDAYVSMIRGRRLEDERTRKRRSERRADVLNANADQYKARQRRLREMLMQLKLKSLSTVEGDLFEMLDEQAQWRHVMSENVKNRDAQRASIEQLQERHREVHLQHALDQEVEQFRVAVADDEARWHNVRSEKERAQRESHYSLCGAVLYGIVELVGDVVEYIDTKQLRVGAEAPCAFDLVPRPVFDALKLGQVYAHDDAAKKQRIVEEHVALRTVGSDAGGPGSAFNSSLLAALVDKLNGIMYPTPEPLRPVDVSPKAFVVLSGPKYSGKTTAAREVAAAMGLEYASDVSIIAECLGALEGELTAEDLASRLVCDRLSLGREIRNRLQFGADMDDALAAELVLFKIRHVAPESAGIVFDSIPRTKEEFKRVEAKLSGYTDDYAALPPTSFLVGHGHGDASPKALDVERPPPPPAEPAPVGKDAKKAEAKAAAGKKDKKKDEQEEPLPAVELPPLEPLPPPTAEEESVLAAAGRRDNVAGLHRIVRIDCDNAELFSRYCGLRVDVETGAEYHVATQPPPLDRMPFVVAKDRSEGDTAKMHAALEEDRETWAEVRPWLSGVYSDVLTTIDGRASLENLVATVRDVADDAVNAAQKAFEMTETAKAIHMQRAELEALYAERAANREAVRRQLHQIYTERGVESMPAELAEPTKAVEEPYLPIPPHTPSAVMSLLRRFEDYYRSAVARLHGELARLLGLLFDHGVGVVAQFDGFCKTPDAKQRLLDAYVKDLNAMPPALRSDVQGKEELHLRADGLWEGLVALVEKRRDDGAALVDGLLAPPAFLDQWNDAGRLVASLLMQLELERVQLVRQMAAVYYGSIRGETVPAEDADALVDLVALPRSAEVAAEATKAPSPKDPKGKPAAKKGGPPQPVPKEEEPKNPEDSVSPILDKAGAYLKAVCERLAAPPQPVAAPAAKGKPSKAAAETPAAPDVPTAANLCVQLVASEADAAKVRIAELGKFLTQLLARGVERNAAIRAELLTRLRTRLQHDMTAVNSCLLHLRSTIEEEAPITFALVMSPDGFRIDFGRCIGPRPEPAPIQSPRVGQPQTTSDAPSATASSSTVALTSALTSHRMQEILKLFVAVAPEYSIHIDDFVKIVSPQDWATGGGEPASAVSVFKRFDAVGGGAVDWRDFVVHLLFWSEPLSGAAGASTGAFAGQNRNPFHVEGPTLLQLFDLKTDLGTDPLTKEQFVEMELFFEVQMEPERLEAYKEALWSTFAKDGSLDPNEFVLFLCADDQPLRGVQKAFAMGAVVGDEVCSLDTDMMYRVFHFSTCNSAAFETDDMYSHDELDKLYSAARADTLNFQDVCGIGMGRVLLNNTTAFRRKRFTA
jgi:hypothetical protein